VQATYYRIGVNNEYIRYYEPIVISDEGQNDLYVYTVDQAGNQEMPQYVRIDITKTGDMTPPVTSAEYPAVWVSQDAKVMLTAIDDESGVKETRYRLNDVEWQVGNEFDVSAEGINAVDFFSLDFAGNVERTKTITVKIDKTAPLSNAEMFGIRLPDGSYHGVVTITLASEDSLSGVKAIYYRVNDSEEALYAEPFTIDNIGDNYVEIYAVDQAENRETVHGYNITVQESVSIENPTLWCNQLTIYGNTSGDNLYCNGPIAIYGNGLWNELGTSESSYSITGQNVVENAVINGTKKQIPQPNWQALSSVTEISSKNSIFTDATLSDIRFEGDAHITGATKLCGLLVVKGNLIFNGDVELDNACIICSGEITITSGIQGTGLIYSSSGLTVWGNCEVNGAVIIDGPVLMAGTETFFTADVEEFLKWFL
jgi:cytoskeletal protein CcmA (bactofilin family)